MPVFAYTGTHRDTGTSDGNIDPAGIQMYGLWFERGRTVEVTDAFAARKLAGNPYFRAVADAVAPSAPAGLPVEAPEIGAALTLAGDPLAEALANALPDAVVEVVPGPIVAATKKPKRK